MRILGRVVPLKYAVGAAAVLLAISGSVAVVATTSFDAKPPPHVAVPGVSAERLAEGGISLSPASAAEASVTPDSAVRAGSVLGLSKVRGTVLAQLHDSSSVPNIDRLVWVVSFDPTGSGRSAGGPFDPDKERVGVPVAWSIAFVDAVTGDLLSVHEGGLP